MFAVADLLLATLNDDTVSDEPVSVADASDIDDDEPDTVVDPDPLALAGDGDDLDAILDSLPTTPTPATRIATALAANRRSPSRAPTLIERLLAAAGAVKRWVVRTANPRQAYG